MIFYYTGTGNSAYVARELSRMTSDRNSPVFIPDVIKNDRLEIDRSKSIGFVFPIYSWGVPPIVISFLHRLPADLFDDKYIWAVCTCGDEAGVAMRRFNKEIYNICGRRADLLMSVIMPNNYVLLPGFNIDTDIVKESKLEEAALRIRKIAAFISEQSTHIYDVQEGSFAALRTALVYPLFKKWGINPRKWHANGNCVNCGKCVDICPNTNITSEDGKPVWGNNCLSCCACFHVCPFKAINYGKATQNKGQYLFPGFPFKP